MQHKTAVVNHVRIQLKEEMEGKTIETVRQTSGKSSGDDNETYHSSSVSLNSTNILETL